jgi:CRP-like cAMP-binding protein
VIGALRRFQMMRRADSLLARSDGDDAIAGAEPTGELGRTYRKGEIILQQGETGDAMFVIQAGSVELVRESDGHELCIAELAEGELFGEMALFEQNIRTTTVRAISEVRLITVDRRLLLRKIHEDASLAFA